MNGIKMSECKFYVDEEKRTVICVIPKTRDMLIDFIQDHFYFKDIDLSHSTYFRFMKNLPSIVEKYGHGSGCR